MELRRGDHGYEESCRGSRVLEHNAAKARHDRRDHEVGEQRLTGRFFGTIDGEAPWSESSVCRRRKCQKIVDRGTSRRFRFAAGLGSLTARESIKPSPNPKSNSQTRPTPVKGKTLPQSVSLTSGRVTVSAGGLLPDFRQCTLCATRSSLRYTELSAPQKNRRKKSRQSEVSEFFLPSPGAQ
ncbi:hypothetical protein CRG98_007470 [Punica granatum]|uniref:Uncharacterized protein n=1 Tax=Punica granatum TaxID=22663 RepID=A0A2I0KUK9_PUNGR|nr:hypothetical protein CRG98_007470 [Punica granatum]